MTICRTLDEIRAAAREAAAKLPPPSQDVADLVAALLSPYQTPERTATR